VCPIWLITNAGDAPASYRSDANVRRSEWFVMPAWIGGRPIAARSSFALAIAGTRIWFVTFARCSGVPEAFRAIYGSRDRSEAEQQLARFLTGCRLAAIPSFDAFADGVRLWQQELLAYFDEPVTNGYAEGVINKIKVIKRRAYGLPTFEGFRRRVLVACA
jgi:hypothetical protein